MTISRHWQMAVAAAEVAEGLICLVTGTLWRPCWAAPVRLAALLAAALRVPRVTASSGFAAATSGC